MGEARRRKLAGDTTFKGKKRDFTYCNRCGGDKRSHDKNPVTGTRTCPLVHIGENRFRRMAIVEGK